MTHIVAKFNKLPTEAIRIRMWQGSLAVEVETDDPIQMPNDDDMAAAVNRGIAEKPLTATMAENIAPVPWSTFRATRGHVPWLDGSVITHNP